MGGVVTGSAVAKESRGKSDFQRTIDMEEAIQIDTRGNDKLYRVKRLPNGQKKREAVIVRVEKITLKPDSGLSIAVKKIKESACSVLELKLSSPFIMKVTEAFLWEEPRYAWNRVDIYQNFDGTLREDLILATEEKRVFSDQSFLQLLINAFSGLEFLRLKILFIDIDIDHLVRQDNSYKWQGYCAMSNCNEQPRTIKEEISAVLKICVLITQSCYFSDYEKLGSTYPLSSRAIGFLQDCIAHRQHTDESFYREFREFICNQLLAVAAYSVSKNTRKESLDISLTNDGLDEFSRLIRSSRTASAGSSMSLILRVKSRSEEAWQLLSTELETVSFQSITVDSARLMLEDSLLLSFLAQLSQTSFASLTLLLEENAFSSCVWSTILSISSSMNLSELHVNLRSSCVGQTQSYRNSSISSPSLLNSRHFSLQSLTINLSENDLDKEEVGRLAKSLSTLSNLTKLDINLNGNHSRSSGFSKLISSISTLTLLKSLRLAVSSNSIEQNGIVYLSKLSRLHCLEKLSLDLSSNSFISNSSSSSSSNVSSNLIGGGVSNRKKDGGNSLTNLHISENFEGSYQLRQQANSSSKVLGSFKRKESRLQTSSPDISIARLKRRNSSMLIFDSFLLGGSPADKSSPEKSTCFDFLSQLPNLSSLQISLKNSKVQESLLKSISQSLPQNLRVLRLDLRGNPLVKQALGLFQQISLVPNLEELEVLVDKLYSIPLVGSRLRKLKRLAVSGVMLKSLTISSFVSFSPTLQELELKLSIVQLGNSFITTLATQLTHLSSLKILKLFLSRTGLSFFDSQTSNSTPPHSPLQNMLRCSRTLSSSEDRIALKNLSKALASMNDLTCLQITLSDNDIRNAGLEQLFGENFLSSKHFLKEFSLNLKDCQIWDFSPYFQALEQAALDLPIETMKLNFEGNYSEDFTFFLGDLKQLKQLVISFPDQLQPLSDNEQSPSIVSLAMGIGRVSSTLESLELNFNGLNVNDLSLAVLKSEISNCKQLVSCELQLNNAENLSNTCLFESTMERLQSYEGLFNFCYIDSLGLKENCAALSLCKSLTSLTLDVSHNKVSSNGMVALGQCLQSLKTSLTILSLNVSANPIEAGAVNRFFAAVGEQMSLIALNVDVSRISMSSGLVDASAVVPTASPLRELTLRLRKTHISQVSLRGLFIKVSMLRLLREINLDLTANRLESHSIMTITTMTTTPDQSYRAIPLQYQSNSRISINGGGGVGRKNSINISPLKSTRQFSLMQVPRDIPQKINVTTERISDRSRMFEGIHDMLCSLSNLATFRIDLMQNSLSLSSGLFALTTAVVMSGRNLHHLKIRSEDWRLCYPAFMTFFMKVKDAARAISLQANAVKSIVDEVIPLHLHDEILSLTSAE